MNNFLNRWSAKVTKQSTSSFKENRSVPPRSSTDSECTLFNLASKKVWNKATNVGEVSDHCSDTFLSPNTRKRNISVTKQRLTLKHHGNPDTETEIYIQSPVNAARNFVQNHPPLLQHCLASRQLLSIRLQQICVQGAAPHHCQRCMGEPPLLSLGARVRSVSGWKEQQSCKALEVLGSVI